MAFMHAREFRRRYTLARVEASIVIGHWSMSWTWTNLARLGLRSSERPYKEVWPSTLRGPLTLRRSYVRREPITGNPGESSKPENTPDPTPSSNSNH